MEDEVTERSKEATSYPHEGQIFPLYLAAYGTFAFYFIPAKPLKKITVVVEISTTTFTRNVASVSVHSLWQLRMLWTGEAPLREQFTARLPLSLFQKHRHFLGQKRFLVQKVEGTFCHDNLSDFRNTPDSPAGQRGGYKHMRLDACWSRSNGERKA